MLSNKNSMLSQAGQDLGLGDQLKNQTEEEIAKRRKKLQAMQAMGMSPGSTMGSAAASLGLGGTNAY